MVRLLFVIVAAGALSWPQASRASGSVGLTVADEGSWLHIRQTFRKILPAGEGGDYADGVREDFLRLAATVHPRVVKMLRSARRTVKSLRADFRGVTVHAHCNDEPPCELPKDLAFPAAVQLHSVQSKHGRERFTLTLPFETRPSAATIRRLHRRFEAAVEAGKGKRAEEPLGAQELEAKVIRGGAWEMTIRLDDLWIHPGARAHYQSRLDALSTAARAAIEKALAAAKALKFGAWDPDLPGHDEKKGFPSRIWVGGHHVLAKLNASFVLAGADAPEAIQRFVKDLEKAFEAL